MERKTLPKERKHLLTKLPADLYERLRLFAFQNNQFMTYVVIEALESFLGKREKK
jgi:hypothetical protein